MNILIASIRFCYYPRSFSRDPEGTPYSARALARIDTYIYVRAYTNEQTTCIPGAVRTPRKRKRGRSHNNESANQTTDIQTLGYLPTCQALPSPSTHHAAPNRGENNDFCAGSVHAQQRGIHYFIIPSPSTLLAVTTRPAPTPFPRTHASGRETRNEERGRRANGPVPKGGWQLAGVYARIGDDDNDDNDDSGY